MEFQQIRLIKRCQIIISNYTNKFLITLLIAFLLTQCITQNGNVYGDEWALHIKDGEVVANALAARHNLVNLGEVLPDSELVPQSRRDS